MSSVRVSTTLRVERKRGREREERRGKDKREREIFLRVWLRLVSRFDSSRWSYNLQPSASASRPLSSSDSPPSLALPLGSSLASPFLPPLLRMIARASASALSRRASRLNGVCAPVCPSVGPYVRSFVRLYPSSPGSFRAREYVWVVSRPVYARLARMPFLPRLLPFVCKLSSSPFSPLVAARIATGRSAFSRKDDGKANGGDSRIADGFSPRNRR